MSRLGDILVAMGAATPALVRAAAENQIIMGGRLGTNLLEIHGVTEEALARALSERHGGIAWAHGDVEVDPAAIALLRREVADRLEAVPARLDGRRLDVLVADPGKLGEIAFATGKVVRPIVVAEIRLWALLRKHYRIERQLRGLNLDPPAPAAAAARPVVLERDLMGEEDFAALYERTDEARPAPWARDPSPPPGPSEGPPAAPPAAPPPAPPLDDLPLPGTPDGAWTAPIPPPHRAPVAASRTPAPTAPRPAALEPPARVEEDPPPLEFAEAVAALAGVADRNAIARTVLRFARSRFRRAVLLAIHGQLAEGWDGVGEGISARTIARIQVGVAEPGVVHTVVETRAHFLGPLQRTEQNIRLLRALGRGAPRTSFAMPILARGRVVNVLYADDGRGELVDGSRVGELLILASKIAQSYEALLARARR